LIVSHGNPTILFINGISFPGGTKTTTSHLLSSPYFGVILSTIIKSLLLNVVAILDHSTVYGINIKNLITQAIPAINTKNAKISKKSRTDFFRPQRVRYHCVKIL
jgi:hypothetical protein